nr:uncharacterized protein LOC109770795 [Aegilops tauschii subsp. strangulata]
MAACGRHFLPGHVLGFLRRCLSVLHPWPSLWLLLDPLWRLPPGISLTILSVPLFSSCKPPAIIATPPASRYGNLFNDHITNHIKFKLDPAQHNYHKWRAFFLFVLLTYNAAHHVQQKPPAHPNDLWNFADIRIALWIYSVVADSLIDLLPMDDDTTAYQLSCRIHDYFLASRAVKYMQLKRQYRNLKQGDLPITGYARWIEVLADGLVDVEQPVSDADLAMQLFQGLDQRFEPIHIVLGDTVPLLSFDVVMSRLLLAEDSLAQRTADTSAFAFSITTGGGLSNGVDRGDRGDRSGDHDEPPGRSSGNGSDHPGNGLGSLATGAREGGTGDRDRDRGRGWWSQ